VLRHDLLQTLATGHEATRQCIGAPEEQIALSLHIFSRHPGNVTMSRNTPLRNANVPLESFLKK